MNILRHLPTQVIKPMLLKHVLDFEKVEQILERLIVHQGTTFPQQIKYDNKLDAIFQPKLLNQCFLGMFWTFKK